MEQCYAPLFLFRSVSTQELRGHSWEMTYSLLLHVGIRDANSRLSSTFRSDNHEQSRIQKLHCIQKLVFRNYFVVFRNYFVVFRNYFVIFRNYFVVFRNYFVVFRNYFRRIQKLLSLMLRNFYYQTRGRCEQPPAWSVDAFSCIQGGVGGVGLGQ